MAVGYTDMRKQIDGLSALVTTQFNLDPFSNSVFLFCGRNTRVMKALYWEGDGFVLLYKRLENGRFKWPRDESEAIQMAAGRTGSCTAWKNKEHKSKSSPIIALIHGRIVRFMV